MCFTVSKPSRKIKRQRGVVLSTLGWQTLQGAQTRAEQTANSKKPFSLEDLSEITGLSPHTLIKVRRREAPVDRQTLEIYFKSFDLPLTPEDYCKPNQLTTVESVSRGDVEHTEEPSAIETKPDPDFFQIEGQVALNSGLYIDRPPIETDCYQAILQAGTLIRIKAPRRMGKTSLMARILNHATQAGCQTVFLSLQLADQEIFQELSKFLQWFSVNVGRELGLANELTNYWDDMFGSKMSCKIYFEQYLLAQTSQPIVLALDDVDRLFSYPELADEFFGLLRTWHEEAKNREIWKKLRLIVAHSTDIYIPLNVNKSPFNVGLPIELRPFTIEQVLDLTRRYGLALTRVEAEQLMITTNGYPYLVQLALYYLRTNRTTLKTLLKTAATPTGVYRDHLNRQFLLLEREPDLAAAFQETLKSSTPVPLAISFAFKLESMGLVKLQGNEATPHCSLYNQYFRERLSMAES